MSEKVANMRNTKLHTKRAREAWPFLVSRANSGGEPYTYIDLGREIGGVHQRVAGYYLGVIQDECAKQKWPMLQALAVNAGTKVPGRGYHGARGKEDHGAEIMRVRAKKNWSMVPPF